MGAIYLCMTILVMVAVGSFATSGILSCPAHMAESNAETLETMATPDEAPIQGTIMGTDYGISDKDVYANFGGALTSVMDIDTTISNDTTVTVDFDSNGGSDIESQTIEKGAEAIKPIDPKREGYVFDGWCLDEECTTLWVFETPVFEDTTLYAKWKTVTVENIPAVVIPPETDDSGNMWFNFILFSISLFVLTTCGFFHKEREGWNRR